MAELSVTYSTRQCACLNGGECNMVHRKWNDYEDREQVFMSETIVLRTPWATAEGREGAPVSMKPRLTKFEGWKTQSLDGLRSIPGITYRFRKQTCKGESEYAVLLWTVNNWTLKCVQKKK